MYQNGKNIIFIDRSVAIVNSILNSISKSKPLSREKEYDLWLRMCQGSMQAREQLVKANLRYVVTLAKKYLASGAAFEDLFQAGCEGIILAADKFDASRGFRFISFATWYIEYEIRKVAYDFIHHDCDSLDQPINDDDVRSAAHIDLLPTYSNHSADWHLLYNDALDALKSHTDKRLYGAGELVADMYAMSQKGYTVSDFANKHHLNDEQIHYFLDILQEEARDLL